MIKLCKKILEPYWLVGRHFFKNIKKKIVTLDNERLAIAVASVIGICLLLPLMIIAPGLFETDWFLNLMIIPSEYGSFIAEGAYLGRLWNLMTVRSYGKKTRVKTLLNSNVIINRQIGYAEKLFTPIGMFFGVSLAVFCIALHVVVPFLGVFSYFAYILFILAYACSLGGLFNRLASAYDGTRLPQEKKAILVGVMLGLLIALSLFMMIMLTGTMPFIAVQGLSKPLIELLLLHKVLFALPFILSLTSLTTSVFDYFAKAYCFLCYKLGSTDQLLNTRIKLRLEEYKGAFFGTCVGCVLALGIIIGLFLTGGLEAAPIVVMATLFVTVIVCNNVWAALFSRIGRLVDGIKRIYKVTEVQVENQQDLVNSLEIQVINSNSRLSLPSLNQNAKPNKTMDLVHHLKRTKSCPSFFSRYEQESYYSNDEKLLPCASTP